MSWDTMTQSKSDSTMFIKLKDGQSIEGVFIGEPHCFYSTYGDFAEYPEWKEGRSFKFKINFVMRDESGNLSAKIYTGNSRLRDALLDVKNEYGLDCVFKVKRTGAGQSDTRYSILFKTKLSPEQYEKIKAVKLHELTKGRSAKKKEEPNESFPPDDFDEFPPVDTDLGF